MTLAARSASGVLVASCISTFVVNANTSAVSILLPAISDDTGASLQSLQWAVTGYSLVGAAVIVTSGALGDIFGRRRVFIAGLLLFVASCILIALAQGGALVIAGRAVQGAAGSTILACGLSLLSAASAGSAQMRLVSLWGAASAAGAAAGPLVGGVLVDATGWQGLFWIDAGIAAATIPLTLRTVGESRDPSRPRSIDFGGTLLVAGILVPFVFAVTEGAQWGWLSAQTLVCIAVSIVCVFAFAALERRVRAPLIDLTMLQNKLLVGSTVAILLCAGCINALMYITSLYFQDPATLRMSPLTAGLATLPAAAGVVATAPLITPFVRRVGSRTVIVAGFAAATIGLGAFGFIEPSWKYAAMVGPLIVIAAGLGLGNGPASSISTACVPEDQVGAASGISNMGRYVGAAVLTSVTAAVYNTVTTNHRDGGASASASLAAGFSRAAIALAVFCACGIALAALVGRHRGGRPETIHYAAAAAATSHTVPTSPTGGVPEAPPQDARSDPITENLPIHPETPPRPAP